MSVSIEWNITDHVILVVYSDDITIDDIKAQYKATSKMYASSIAPLVHMVVDTTEVRSFPTKIAEYRRIFGTPIPNAGWVVLVGDNKMIRLIVSIVSNFTNTRFAYVRTREEALDYIQKRDGSVVPQ